MYEHAHIPLSATVSASEPMSEPVSTAADLYKQYAQDAQAEGRSAAATHVAAPAPIVQAAVPAQFNAVLEVPKVQKAPAEPAAKAPSTPVQLTENAKELNLSEIKKFSPFDRANAVLIALAYLCYLFL